MGKKIPDYIVLSFLENSSGEFVRNKEKSWFITVNKEGTPFSCQNLFVRKITKMNSVENFLKLWIDDMNTIIDKERTTQKAEIVLHIQSQPVSRYLMTSNLEKSLDIALKYISMLKDDIVTTEDITD